MRQRILSLILASTLAGAASMTAVAAGDDDRGERHATGRPSNSGPGPSFWSTTCRTAG